MSLVPTWLAAAHCRHDPGGGRHAHPTSSQSGRHPTSHCTCPLSPSTRRVGRRSPRHGAWARRRRARRGGVSHASEPLQSRWESPPQSTIALPETVGPGEPCEATLPPSETLVQAALGCATPGSALETQPASPARGGRRRGRWGARGRGGGAKRAFILPIHLAPAGPRATHALHHTAERGLTRLEADGGGLAQLQPIPVEL
jgi:hypothetical protein